MSEERIRRIESDVDDVRKRVGTCEIRLNEGAVEFATLRAELKSAVTAVHNLTEAIEKSDARQQERDRAESERRIAEARAQAQSLVAVFWESCVRWSAPLVGALLIWALVESKTHIAGRMTQEPAKPKEGG